MSLAAEFRRNLWLELSPQRLVALPVIVAVLLLLSQVAGGGSYELMELGTWTFYLMVFLWGSRRAAAAVSEEVNGNTWTGQRLSALSPAALVLGKLFGTTAFVWYGGLLGLGLYIAGWLGGSLPVGGLLLELLQRLASGVFLHAVAIAATLVLLNKRRLAGRLGTTLPQLLALGAALLLVGLFARASLFSGFRWDAAVDWYGGSYDSAVFVAATALIFAAWAVLACLRLMATQLQRLPLPWAWPTFTLFVIAFMQGFASGQPEGSFGWRLAAPFAIALLLLYGALFAERNEPLRYRQCFAAFSGGQLRRGLALLPWWLFGWLILLAVALWRGGEGLELGLWRELARELRTALPDPLLANLGFVAFALRDAAFVLWINAGRGQRGDLTAFIYLLVLYGPLLALLAGMEAWALIPYLAPLPVGPAIPVLFAALAQAALLGFLTLRRWRRLFAA